MVWSQPSGFTPPSTPTAFGNYNFKSFLASANLGTLVAAQYFQSVNGTSTVGASATSSVVTSTLPAASMSMSVSASGSGMASSGASSVRSGSASASAAASSAPASAGDKTVRVAAGGLVAAIFGAVMML